MIRNQFELGLLRTELLRLGFSFDHRSFHMEDWLRHDGTQEVRVVYFITNASVRIVMEEEQLNFYDMEGAVYYLNRYF